MIAPPPTLSFVIPVYNESENIEAQFHALQSATDLATHEIIVIYDSEKPIIEKLRRVK